jgi:hypothetical protein
MCPKKTYTFASIALHIAIGDQDASAGGDSSAA